jgi:hypothetical protein
VKYSKEELKPGVKASLKIINKRIHKIREALETVTNSEDTDLFVAQLTVLRWIVRDIRELQK